MNVQWVQFPDFSWNSPRRVDMALKSIKEDPTSLKRTFKYSVLSSKYIREKKCKTEKKKEYIRGVEAKLGIF